MIIELAIPSEAHHELREPKWEGVAAVDLPEMEGLAVRLDDLLHVLALDGAGDPRHEEDAALNLVLVGVPQRHLRLRQHQEQRLRHEVLDANEAGVSVGAVVDQALPHFLVLVGAEVVRLHLPRHVIGVEVETKKEQYNFRYKKEKRYNSQDKKGLERICTQE